MTKYLINRILRALISVIIVVGVIMVMVYTFLNKQSIFATDPVFTKQKLNGKETYMMQQWELFGYLDYINYTDFLKEKLSWKHYVAIGCTIAGIIIMGIFDM